MYLPAGFSGLCMWKEIQRKGDHKKTDLPGKEEMEENPRSKSAKLRIFEKMY